MKPNNIENIENEMNIEIGKRFSELRRLKKLTQSDVEQKTGIKQETVSTIENKGKSLTPYHIKQLVELYETTYDKVLGKPNVNAELEFTKPGSVLESIDLLYSMCENTESEELNQVVTAYVNMCVYCIIRELYEANPKNSGKLFSLDKDTALKKTMKYIEKEPQKLSAFIKASNGKIKKTAIEPPLEKAAEFRDFIKQSESFITNILTD